jgi:tRNA A-37 threonylcarbamoyl transferase component Bud32
MTRYLNPGDTVLIHFEVVELLACGGQAAVYKGRDHRTGKLVAIKQLDPSSAADTHEIVQRFIQEGNLRFGHPHLPDPIICAQQGDHWFLILPYIEGMPLDQFVQSRGGMLSYQESVAIVDQVADALSALHRAKVIHRDVKPQNIIIQPDGHSWLIDLGIAKCLDKAAITQVSGPIGTCQWMSPEQRTCDPGIDHRSDLYALGATWYWMMTGKPLVTGQGLDEITAQILHQVPAAPSTLERTIPPHIDAACLRLLAKSPAARFANAAELRQALRGPASPSARPFCTACGQRAEATARFCGSCGADFSLREQPACLACGAPVDHAATCPGCQRPFSPANHRILFHAGPLAGKELRFAEGIYAVGRAQLAPRDAYISKVQMHVAATNGTVHIQDAGSTNKTHVDGRIAAVPTLLHPGSQIMIAGNLAIYQKH